MFLQGKAVRVNTSLQNPDAKRIIYRAPDKHKTSDELRHEEERIHQRQRERSKTTRFRKPFVAIRPSSAQSKRSRRIVESPYRSSTPLQPITPYAVAQLSDVYNTDYHHLQVVLKQREVPKYEKTLEHITLTPKGTHSRMSDTRSRSSVSLPVSARDVILDESNDGNYTYEEYITALRYQEVKLLEEKKQHHLDRQRMSYEHVSTPPLPTTHHSLYHERWYELKDPQFTVELQKFNSATL
jgi:hypothetical protein